MDSLYNKLIYFLEKFLSNKYWYVISSGLVVIIILFLTSPSYYALSNDFKPCNDCADFQAVINQADHLTNPIKYPVGTHLANTQLRLTVPVIARLIGTRSKITIFIIQEILGIAFLAITCLLSYRITKDRIVSAVLTLSIGFIYVGKAAFVDVEGLLDSFAYFFLLMAIFINNRPLILMCLLLAYFTDERAFLSSSLVAVFYLVEFLDKKTLRFGFNSIIRARVFYIVISWGLFFLIRFTLFKLYGLSTPKSGVVMPDLHQLGDVFWEGLQGFWLLLTICIIYLIKEKRYFILTILTISILVIVISTTMVYDLTRSIAYIFPIIFVSLYFAEKILSKIQMRKVIILICLICFLCPDSSFVVYAKPDFYRSVPIKAIEKVLSHMHL